MQKEFCFDCGGRGEKPNGEPCGCVEKSVFTGFESQVCDFIPSDYGTLRFSDEMLPTETSMQYRSLMKKLYTEISALQFKQNIYVFSKPKSGKTVLAYSAISNLFSKGLPVFPLMDMSELRRIMNDIDNGRSYLHKENANYDLENIYKSKYLFIKLTDLANPTVSLMSSMYQIVDRRARKGNFTIFLSNYPWGYLDACDTQKTFTCLKGDGTLGTVKVANDGGSK